MYIATFPNGINVCYFACLHSPPTTWRGILDTKSSKHSLVSVKFGEQYRCNVRLPHWKCAVIYIIHAHITQCRDTHIMLFKVPNVLCSDSQHQAFYAHHSVPIMLTIISILQTYNTWQFVWKHALYDSFLSTTHISVITTDKLQLHVLDYAAHWTLEKHYIPYSLI